MVRVTDLHFLSDSDIKLEDPSVFGLSDGHFSLHSDWSDETPPDTPRFGSPSVSKLPFAFYLLEEGFGSGSNWARFEVGRPGHAA